MRRFRRLNKWYAFWFGYFWIPCPKCGLMFGGHEMSKGWRTIEVGNDNYVICWRHDDDLAFHVEKLMEAGISYPAEADEHVEAIQTILSEARR